MVRTERDGLDRVGKVGSCDSKGSGLDSNGNVGSCDSKGSEFWIGVEEGVNA